MVKRFILQWHLSEHCNLHCLHCYQDGHKPVCLRFDELKNIYEQYKKLLKKLKMKGHINITGGEPICNPFFFKILDLIKNDSELITFSILSNGTLIDDEMARKITNYKPYYVQVSLEGGKKTNDYIRGKGTYKLIGKGIDNLKKYGIFTSISFTATKINYKEFPRVVKFAKKHKVDNVWSDRYIPIGKEDKSLMLNYKDTRSYLKIMENEREKLIKKNISIPTISMYRALQFQMTNDFAYGCTAGDTLLTIMENGDLVPCRRMPVVIGNLLKEDMYELYKKSDFLIELRKNQIPDDCKLCDNSELCRGGLKCLTYAIYNDLNHIDVGCDFNI